MSLSEQNTNMEDERVPMNGCPESGESPEFNGAPQTNTDPAERREGGGEESTEEAVENIRHEALTNALQEG